MSLCAVWKTKMAALVKSQNESLPYYQTWGSIEQGREGAPVRFCTAGWRHCTPISSSLHQLSQPPSILCSGNIRITKECNKDYQIDITDGLFFPVSSTCSIPPFPSPPRICHSLTHSLSCSPWLICVFTLCPSRSLTASGYVWREKHLMNRRTWKERDRGL